MIALWGDEGVLGRVCGVGWLGRLGGLGGGHAGAGGIFSRGNLGGRLLWDTCKLLGNVHGFWRLCYIFMLGLLSLSSLICDIGLFLGRIKGSRIVIVLRLKAGCVLQLLVYLLLTTHVLAVRVEAVVVGYADVLRLGIVAVRVGWARGGGSSGVEALLGRVLDRSHGRSSGAEGGQLEGDYVWVFGTILELWEDLWESVCVMERARRDGAEVGNSLELGTLVVCHQRERAAHAR